MTYSDQSPVFVGDCPRLKALSKFDLPSQSPTKLLSAPIFLVELMSPPTGEVQFSDVCARLDVSVEKAIKHLKSYLGESFRAEASYDAEGQLCGIGFFGLDGELASCITAYRMDRDDEIPSDARVIAACTYTGPALDQALNQLLRS